MTAAAITAHTSGAATSESAAHRRNRLVRLIQGFATDPNSVLERQLCTAAVFLLSQLLLFIPGVSVTAVTEVLIANLLALAATAGAFVLRAPHVPPRAAMIIPLVDILAVGLLRAGTGGQTSIFTIMMALPVLSLGVEPGRLPMLIGGPVTVAALLLPLVGDPNALADGQWSRIIFGPVILGLVCLSANELTRRLRSRVKAVQKLQREQQQLLMAAEDQAAMAAAASGMLRESSGQLSSVINAVTEQSIIATDRTGRIEVFNAGAQKMLKVAAHDAIGRPITQFHRPDELTSAENGPLMQDAAAVRPHADSTPFRVLTAEVRPGSPRLGDWTYVTGDGSEKRVQVAVTAKRDAGDDLDGFLFVATDVTAEREQAKTRDEFVNLISHELRTPLSSILGYLELISDDEENPLSEEQHRYLVTVERNANRLLRLVSDLLFTAQVESGRFQLQEQSVDLHRVLANAVETATPVAATRDVRVRLAESTDDIRVWGDPVRLGQAVDNLVSNAVKFTPSGGRVAVTLGIGGGEDGKETRALVCVSDTGIGIPADEMDRLFSRFFRATTATKNAVPGVGLGLTITKAIAAAHGGEIRVASTVGEGTTFTLDLPMIDDVNADTTVATARSE
ncbi:sensor histidine kinase [Nakamurella sp. GG22]